MPRKAKPDHLERKWQWAKTQWEMAKETGLVDESRKQPVLSPVGDGRRANRDAREDPQQGGDES